MRLLALPRLAWIGLLLALPPAPAAGADGPAPLDLSAARVLASPGTPGGLGSFLPPGRPVEPLSWPLPEGPVLLLGLPETDRLAHEIADAFDLLPEDGDLHGGYALAAWLDRGPHGARPIVLLMGADPAALYAARFELETVAGAAGGPSADPTADPDLALKEGRPLATGGVQVAPGRRGWRPPYRTRTFVPGPGACDDCALAAGTHANRIWLEGRAVHGADLARKTARLRAIGVEPVLRITRPDESDLETLLLAQREAGVRHFAFELTDWPADLIRTTTLVAALRPGGLEDVLVYGGPAIRPEDLRLLPEAVYGWRGPETSPASVTAADARAARRRTGLPLVFLETWMGGPRATRLPSMPTGRDPGLGEVVEGIVILGGEPAAPILDQAWDPSAPPADDPLDVLLPLVPVHVESPAALLLRASEGYAGPEAFSLRLRAMAASLPEEGVYVVPTVRDPIVLDGARSERAWAYSVRIPLGRLEAYAVTDGRRLYLAADPDPTHRHDLLVADEEGEGQSIPFPVVGEIALDRFSLGGDPYPTRVFRLRLDGAQTPAATLVVGR